MRILQGHSGGVRTLAYHPEGTLLASGGEDGHLVLWNPLQGTLVRRASIHTDWIRGVAFSPNGRQFASVGWDSHLIEWGVRSGKGVIRTPAHAEQGWSVAYSPDGSSLATGSGTGVLRIYPSMVNSSPLILRGPSMPITQLIFSSDSRKLLSAGHDRTVREWDAIWGGGPRIVGHAFDWIRCLALSPRGDLIAVGGDAPGIAIKSLADGETIAELRGHDLPVAALAFTSEGQTLISAGRDGVVYLWEVESGESRAAYDWGVGPLASLAVAPDGMTAAAGGSEGQIVVWDLEG